MQPSALVNCVLVNCVLIKNKKCILYLSRKQYKFKFTYHEHISLKKCFLMIVIIGPERNKDVLIKMFDMKKRLS